MSSPRLNGVKKVYLAGPMRGYPEFNRAAFESWAHILRERGYEVFSPAENSVKLFGDAVRKSAEGDEGRMGGDKMTIGRTVFSIDLQYICLHADAVALLDGWEKSKGAIAEHAAACALPIPALSVWDF